MRKYNIFLRSVKCHSSFFIFFLLNHARISLFQWLTKQLESFFLARIDQFVARFLKRCEVRSKSSRNRYFYERFLQSLFSKQSFLFFWQRDETFFWNSRAVFWSRTILIRILFEKLSFVSQTQILLSTRFLFWR